MSDKNYNKDKRIKLKQMNICTRCWKEKAEAGHTKCKKCLSDNTLFRGVSETIEFKERRLI